MYFLYYFSNNHDPFYQLHGAQESSGVIYHKIDIQKTTFRTHLG